MEHTDRELDALIWLRLNDKPLNLLRCRYVDGDVQPHAGYPAGHISPPHYIEMLRNTSIERLKMTNAKLLEALEGIAEDAQEYLNDIGADLQEEAPFVQGEAQRWSAVLGAIDYWHTKMAERDE